MAGAVLALRRGAAGGGDPRGGRRGGGRARAGAESTPALKVLLGQILQGRGGFSEGAGRLAGLAGALLGWRPDEFWRATPAELAAVLAAMAGEPRGARRRATDLARLREMFPD